MHLSLQATRRPLMGYKPCYKVFSHLSALAAEHGSALKIISLNNEDILGEMPPKDIPAMVLARDDMSYSVGLDSSKIMYGALYHPAGRLAIPTGERCLRRIATILLTTGDSYCYYHSRLHRALCGYCNTPKAR